ncbi:hypothetical protein DIPPA_14145 [Diplonema papillatum]|nr:hypothetical protein DIPPA_14145 [Diplonema papillatum]
MRVVVRRKRARGVLCRVGGHAGVHNFPPPPAGAAMQQGAADEDDDRGGDHDDDDPTPVHSVDVPQWSFTQ